MPSLSSEPDLVPGVSVEHLMALAHHLGIENVLRALADVETGHSKLLSEMTLLTALRTVAPPAMATRHLVPKGAE